MNKKAFDWDAAAFFETLTAQNKLCRQLGMKFCRVSGSVGFGEAVNNITTATGFVAVNEEEDGRVITTNTPRTRRVKTVFLYLRHPVGNDKARAEAMANLREVFRQFMSVLIQHRTQIITLHKVAIDEDISFSEVDKYTFSGAACAYFTIGCTIHSDLRYNPDEWLTPVMPQ